MICLRCNQPMTIADGAARCACRVVKPANLETRSAVEIAWDRSHDEQERMENRP